MTGELLGLARRLGLEPAFLNALAATGEHYPDCKKFATLAALAETLLTD